MKATSAHQYRSGHCEMDRHGDCWGVYAGTVCTCPCGHAEPVQEVLEFVPATMPSRVRVFDPVPLLASVWSQEMRAELDALLLGGKS